MTFSSGGVHVFCFGGGNAVLDCSFTVTSNQFGISLGTDPWLECLVAAGMV